ncbi:MAG: alpha-galactosidase [Dehalococcoidia bacterium]|jgi:alpha-galactosidase
MEDKGQVVENQLWRISFDMRSGRISADRRDNTALSVAGALIGLSYATPDGNKRTAGFAGGKTESAGQPLEDVHGRGRQYRFTSSGRMDGLELGYLINLYDDRPFLLMRLEVTNSSRSDICLHDMHLLQAETACGGRVDFAGGGTLNFFKVGWHDWVYSGLRQSKERDVNSLLIMRPFISKQLYNPALPIGRRKGEFWGDGWGLLTDQRSALLAGFASTADQFGVLHVNCRSGAAELTLTAQADGVLLEPGETFKSEWGYLQFIDLPCADPAADYVQAVARQMKARVPAVPPPAQWTHWYHFFQSITADLFIANLNTIDSIRETIPFKIVQLDDGYQSAWGDWTTCNVKFPRGLAHLSDNIKKKGFTSGLWLAPFVVDPRSKTAQEHPEWLVKDKKGKPIVSGYFYDFYGHALDLTQPDVLEHVRSLLETIARKWGYGFVKTDFVYSGALPGVRQNPKITRAQAFRKGMEAVRAGIGEDTFLLGCGCPFGPAVGIVDAMRIGPDTAPNWTPYLWSVKWATPIIKSEKSIGSLCNNIRHTLNLSTLHQQWWWNDPDCLMVRNYDTTLSDDEVISNLSLVGLSGGLLISSDDLTRLPVERQKLVALLTPLMGVSGRPLDLLEREMAELYWLPLNKNGMRWQDVAVFNWSKSAAERSLDLTRLGYETGQRLHVFDFWRKKHSLEQTGRIGLGAIPSHGCRMLRICREGEAPTLVGDTLHITQGCEIESWQVAGKALEISTIDMGRRAHGSLWLSTPGRLVSASCGNTAANFEKANDDIYRLDLDFRGRAVIKIQWE